MKSREDELEVNEQKSITGKKKWITPELGVYGIAIMTQTSINSEFSNDGKTDYS